jgi:hypothetical protein
MPQLQTKYECPRLHPQSKPSTMITSLEHGTKTLTGCAMKPLFSLDSLPFSLNLTLCVCVFVCVCVCFSGGMGRGMAMPQQRPPMGGPGDWGGPRSAGSPVGGPGHPAMGRPGMMGGGPMMSRSNSVPSNSRSMLQQQLMDIGGMYSSPGPGSSSHKEVFSRSRRLCSDFTPEVSFACHDSVRYLCCVAMVFRSLYQAVS